MTNVIKVVHKQCLFGKLVSHFYLKIVFMVVGNVLFSRVMSSSIHNKTGSGQYFQ